MKFLKKYAIFFIMGSGIYAMDESLHRRSAINKKLYEANNQEAWQFFSELLEKEKFNELSIYRDFLGYLPLAKPVNSGSIGLFKLLLDNYLQGPIQELDYLFSDGRSPLTLKEFSTDNLADHIELREEGCYAGDYIRKNSQGKRVGTINRAHDSILFYIVAKGNEEFLEACLSQLQTGLTPIQFSNFLNYRHSQYKTALQYAESLGKDEMIGIFKKYQGD